MEDVFVSNLSLPPPTLGQASRAVSSWDLPSQTTLKFRKTGQNSEAELRNRDIRGEVDDAERRALDNKPAENTRRYGERCFEICVLISSTRSRFSYQPGPIAFASRHEVQWVSLLTFSILSWSKYMPVMTSAAPMQRRTQSQSLRRV